MGQGVGKPPQVDIQRRSTATFGTEADHTPRGEQNVSPWSSAWFVQPRSLPAIIWNTHRAPCSRVPAARLLKVWLCRCQATPRSWLRKRVATQGEGLQQLAAAPCRLQQLQNPWPAPGSRSACLFSTPARPSRQHIQVTGLVELQVLGLQEQEEQRGAQGAVEGRARSTGGWRGRGPWLLHSGGQM